MTLLFAPRQDFVTFGTDQTPGRCEVRAAGVFLKWDERAGYGTSGASLVFTSDKLSPVEIDVYLWEDFHFLEWDLFASKWLVKPPPGVRPRAVGIDHPALNFPPLKITSVVIESVSLLEQDEFGVFKSTIKCKEFRAPRPLFAVANPGIPANTSAPPVPKNATEVMIADLDAQARRRK